MSESVLQLYVGGILAHISMVHLAIIGVLSMALTVFLLIRKKRSEYGAIALGITFFFGMVLLDTAVLIRWCGGENHVARISIESEYLRLIQGGKVRQLEMLANIVAFIPFSLFLSEFLASAKRFSAGRRLGLATLAGFGLSLCIECLQLFLRVGFFELTDLVMNTLGAFVGALISAGVRKVVAGRKSRVIGEGHV